MHLYKTYRFTNIRPIVSPILEAHLHQTYMYTYTRPIGAPIQIYLSWNYPRSSLGRENRNRINPVVIWNVSVHGLYVMTLYYHLPTWAQQLTTWTDSVPHLLRAPPYLSLIPTLSLSYTQCDQIGRFLMFLATNLLTKVGPKDCWHLG